MGMGRGWRESAEKLRFLHVLDASKGAYEIILSEIRSSLRVRGMSLMPECICPNCKNLFTVTSSAFGQPYRCNVCGSQYKLDVDHLARFELPSAIQIQFQDYHGEPFTKFPLSLIIEYGYRLPPLQSNEKEQVLVTKLMFLKAQRDEILSGIMDHKGDYALNRFIRIRVPARREALEMSEARARSPWPILDFERELYGDMQSLRAAYLPGQEVIPLEATIDLAQRSDAVSLELVVSEP